MRVLSRKPGQNTAVGDLSANTVFAPAFSFQSIAARDVARRLAELAVAEPSGRAADIGGPEVLTSRELAIAPENRYGTITFREFLNRMNT